MSSRPPADTPSRPYEVAIVGNDAVLAALPARPMQLAHAILACGYDLVVPVSWGEEVVAEQALRAISAREGAPAVYCACPTLRARLLASGNELAPFLVSLVAPSVATARYLRALQPDAPLRITVIGGCPEARDPSIDTRVAPRDFLHLLANRGIALDRQPAVFDSVVPPDRRRHFSLPGGCPAPRALESRAPDRRLVTITEDAFSSELAEHLLGNESVLIDLSPRLGCACCGGFGDSEHRGPAGREEILRHEPPRSPTPILDHDVAVSVVADLPPAPAAQYPPEPAEPARSAFARREVRRHEPERHEPVRHELLRPERARAVAGEARREAMERVKLPGPVPIESARSRGEKRHIAITPPGAMAPVPAMPSAPKGSGYWEPAHLAAAPPATHGGVVGTVTMRPAPGWHEAGVAREPQGGSRPAPSGPGTASHAAPVPPASPVAHSRPSATRAVPVTPTIPIRVDVEPRSTRPATAPPAAAPPSVPPVAPRRGTVPIVFQLARAATHPRASAGGGKVLPRAYVGRRHTPAALHTLAPAPTPPIVDVERPLAVGVEPAPRIATPGAPSMFLAEAMEQVADEVPPAATVMPQPAALTTEIEVAEAQVAPPAAPEAATPEVAAVDGAAVEGTPPLDIATLAASEDVGPGTDVIVTSVAVLEVALSERAERAATTDDLSEPAGATSEAGADAASVIPVDSGLAPVDHLTTAPSVTEALELGLLETNVIEREDAEPPAMDAGADAPDVDSSSPRDVVEDGDVVARERATPAQPPTMPRSDAVNVDVLARIRQQSRRPGRVMSRDITPPREPREPGRVLVAVTTVVLALALIAALAVIFRRAPTAPW